jgi:hypothetical protein
MTPGNASTTGPVAASRTSAHPATAAAKRLLRQYVYFCTSKASKMSTCTDGCDLHEHLACEPPAYVSLRQHTSAYVSIRQHTSAYISIRQLTSAYVSIRQHTSAHVSTRQHTSAHVSIRQHTSAYVSIPGRAACELQVSFGEPHIHVSIRQHTSAYLAALPASSRSLLASRTYSRSLLACCRARMCVLSRAAASVAAASAASAAALAPIAAAYVQHTAAYVSIRQRLPPLPPLLQLPLSRQQQPFPNAGKGGG